MRYSCGVYVWCWCMCVYGLRTKFRWWIENSWAMKWNVESTARTVHPIGETTSFDWKLLVGAAFSSLFAHSVTASAAHVWKDVCGSNLKYQIPIYAPHEILLAFCTQLSSDRNHVRRTHHAEVFRFGYFYNERQIYLFISSLLRSPYFAWRLFEMKANSFDKECMRIS